MCRSTPLESKQCLWIYQVQTLTVWVAQFVLCENTPSKVTYPRSEICPELVFCILSFPCFTHCKYCSGRRKAIQLNFFCKKSGMLSSGTQLLKKHQMRVTWPNLFPSEAPLWLLKTQSRWERALSFSLSLTEDSSANHFLSLGNWRLSMEWY